MSKIQKSCVTRRSKNIVKTNVQLKIDIWPQRRAHSVNVWIETLCWEHNTVVENAANTISICHCIYTWSIMTHHTQASKVFKWRKKCWLLLKAKQANIAVKHDKQSKPVGFGGGSKIYIYIYVYLNILKKNSYLFRFVVCHMFSKYVGLCFRQFQQQNRDGTSQCRNVASQLSGSLVPLAQTARKTSPGDGWLV